MTKFRIGDHVRVIASPCRYFDDVGTVVAIDSNSSPDFHVAGLEDHALWFHPDELILAERRAEDAA